MNREELRVRGAEERAGAEYRIIYVSFYRLAHSAGRDYNQIHSLTEMREVYYDAMAFCFLLKYLFGVPIKLV